jgi:hypothetical protein
MIKIKGRKTMCRFFSFCSDGKGKLFYFNAEQREALKQSNPHNYEPDSHTSIADFHGYRGAKEDTLNKWEYNPLLKTLVADYINTTNDEAQVSAAMASLDFKTIVPRLRIKPIIHPFKVLRRGAVVTKQEEELLKTWGSVWDSVRGSIWASVRASVRDSVGGSVWDSVGASVWASVGASVWASVGASVWASVGASAWDSVGDSVWASAWASVRTSVGGSVGAYIGSFYDIKDYKFQSAVDLWEAGLVSSFDGKTWRLHSRDGIVYETINI